VSALADRVWYGADGGAALARMLLAPASALFRAGVALRGAMFDAGVLRAQAGAIPAVSVGNLTVGGTGKTPVASWIAAELRARGAHPAIVLRGYGDDEPLVHGRLAPGIPVIVDPDRAAGVARAAAGGADVAVLDDAFQHRRAVRTADVVLVSADRWPAHVRLLPAGPFREPLAALARATLVIITRKSAAEADVARVRAAIAREAPALPVAVVHLRLDALHDDGGEPVSLASLAGASVLAISAVGDPDAFAAQLAGCGALVRTAAFADHHAFTQEDAARIAASLRSNERPLCTLKDFVKLDALWPRQAPPLWYVSQLSNVEAGRDAIDAMLSTLLRARSTHT